MRLRTLGGLWIEAESPPPLGPRPLALLALVAASGRKGISRDRLVGILWAETGEDQARHTLSQTLYSLRRDTGRELILGTTQLRLASELPSDIGELRAAAAAGDLETVAGLYTGKFLDGFYLPGAPEFERWVEEERAGLEREALRALERLATQADQAGSAVDAVRWWHRLAELDPLSARYTAGYMRALAAAGDRSGALARARAYTEAVHRELDAEPDSAVVQLARSLRGSGAAEAISSPSAPPPESLRGGGAAEAISAPPVLPSSRPPVLPTAPLVRPRWFLPSAALVLLAAVALALWSARDRASQALPFLAVGDIRADSSRVLRDMLATSLGGLEGIQVVANSRLVELTPRGADTTQALTADAARRAGATEILEGELATEAGRLVLSLRRVSIPRGVVRKGYIVRAADRYALVDSATAAIARDLRLAPPSVAVADIRTSSPAAYALYEEGLRAYYGYDAPAAYRLMSAALTRDSSFAMAAFYMWQLSRSYADDSTQTAARARARRLAGHTIERERLLIQGSLAELDAPLHEAAAIAETLTVKYPTDPEGQILLGNVRGRQGDWAGAVAAFGRAFTLDSAAGALASPYCRICISLTGESIQYVWWDSAQAAERVARKLLALRPGDPAPWINLAEPLLRQGRRKEGEEADANGGDPKSGGSTGIHLRWDRIRWGQYDAGDRELIEDMRSKHAGVRTDARWLLMLSLRDQGRLREADTLGHDQALLALEMGKPEVSIRVHRDNAAGTLRWNAPPAVRARAIAWNLTLEGTAASAAGDTALVRRLADSLELLGPTSYYGGRDAKLHYVLRGLLLQGEGRHAEAVDAFRRSLYSLTDGYTRSNLMMAKSLIALGRGKEAIAVLRPAIHGGVDGSNTYVSRTELHEALAQAFEQAGQRDSAVVHWRAVESAWRRADPQFRERYLHARLKAGL